VSAPQTTLERAFELARSGRFAILINVVKTLDREGYSVSQIQGPLLKRRTLSCRSTCTVG
jgi:hypothetical protein